MKRSASLLSRQYVCFHCAFQLRSGAERPLRRRGPNSLARSYRVSTPICRPAGPAVAQKEEDQEDEYPELPSTSFSRPPARRTPPAPPSRFGRLPREPSPYESTPDWKCRCGHSNVPNGDNCAMCQRPREASTAVRFPPQPPTKRGFQSRPSQAYNQTPALQNRDRHSRTSYTFRPTLGEDSDPGPRPIGRMKDRPTQPGGSFTAAGPVRIRRARSSSESLTLNEDFNLEDRTGEHANRRSIRRDSAQPTELPLSPRRSRSASIGRSNDAGYSQPASTEFKPFFRRVDSKDGQGNAPSPGDTDTRRFASPENTDAVDTGIGSTFMPPASSSFDNYADERRKKRNGSDRRSERYQLDDADGDGVQTSNSRNNTSKKQRRSQRDLDEEELLLEAEFESRRKTKAVKAKALPVQSKPKLQLPDFISVEQLARVLKVRIDPFLRKLEEEGFEGARYDHILDAESSAMIAESYGLEASFGGRQTMEDLLPQPAAEDKSLLPPRPPVVTIMGHVDHGKTTILDWLRKSSVVATEHGGITQHIGAFSVTMPGSERRITFLDTPGHAAFLEMRRRGAVVTDIVILVVAADDSVKPQTVEAIKHALEAKVHIIVAINKVDKEDANIERVKQDLARNDITVEDYGGEYQAIALSGKTGKGMEELEEAILTLADVSDFRAETDGQAEGWILESKVTPAGRVATMLVRRGTLRLGDFIVAGTTWARVRTLRNDAGVLVDEALPGTPVQVDGWRGEDPTAGLEVLQAENEQHAKDVVEIRLERQESLRIAGDLSTMNSTRTEEADARAKVLAWEAEQTWAKKKRKPTDNEGWMEGASSKGPKEVHFVVKADVAGSVEALVAAVSAVGNNEIRANVIHSGTGVLSESDIRHLAATGETAYAISFNQPVDGSISQLARAAGLQILDHNIIYKVTDDVRDKLSAELPPLVTQRVLGEAEVGKLFQITTKQGKVKIAGCKISNGLISRSHQVRVLRDGECVYSGKLDSLKNVKKDVTEMRKGSECGMGFGGWEDIREGDQVQCFEEESSPRKLY